MKNLKESIKYMTKISGDNISVRRKATSNMVKASISLKKVAPIMRANGRTIKCKERVKLTSNRVNFSTPENGRLTSIMVGEFFTPILPQTPSGFHTKVSSKMGSSKVVVSSGSKTH